MIICEIKMIKCENRKCHKKQIVIMPFCVNMNGLPNYISNTLLINYVPSVNLTSIFLHGFYPDKYIFDVFCDFEVVV